MRVVAAVVHHNNAERARLVVDAIRNQVAAVAIIDNDSGASGRAAVDDLGIHVIRSENLGFGHAANLGCEWARAQGADALLLLNHDCVLASDACRRLSDALADSSVGAAAPVLRDGHRQFAGGTLDPKTWRTNQLDKPASSGSYDVPWADGAATLFRLAALQDVGGFDERYFLYFEDADIGLRLRRRGWRVVVVPAALGSHTVSGGFLLLGSLRERNYLLFLEATAPRRVHVRQLLWTLYAIARGAPRRTVLTRARVSGLLRYLRRDWQHDADSLPREGNELRQRES